jgi:hypothetical protein
LYGRMQLYNEYTYSFQFKLLSTFSLITKKPTWRGIGLTGAC